MHHSIYQTLTDKKVADLTKKTENYSKLEEQGKTEEIKNIAKNENISVKIT
ncbi:hypothetical protein SLVCU148_0226, partial [Staphylococcus lugdunensis VCU148]